MKEKHWILQRVYRSVLSAGSHPCPPVSREPTLNMWNQSQDEKKQSRPHPWSFKRKAETGPCFNVTIWSLRNTTNAARRCYPLTWAEILIFVSQTWGSWSIKCILWGNAIQSHRFLPSITLIWQAKNSLSFSILQSKPIHFFFASLRIYLTVIFDGLRNVFPSFLHCVLDFCIPAYSAPGPWVWKAILVNRVMLSRCLTSFFTGGRLWSKTLARK